MKKKDDNKFDLKLNRVVYAILAVLLLIGGTAIFVYHAQQNDPESSEYTDDSITNDRTDFDMLRGKSNNSDKPRINLSCRMAQTYINVL
ncbi:hypothetical protein H5S40_03535 [Limosilactobacillus sp. RRLNB_1_1]|uniref:Uncharacterized protein n=1 Tax=Limosilactobacillus albertensis TaxID=2759752 RepID=A0A7W3TRG8_9LACO|nr:hypothetical protein [Limosilactobacillus albertensis]MBB1069226.1 hypothetical protein [Limosilactobacillus albertensis]MCD7118476.1 hypothetical protein [Limosilactobacillus albertensis]MCD7128619.1 hypothetical protein [Limosilactobacillus albertensis]